MENNKELLELLEKYRQGICTKDEILRLQEWYRRIGPVMEEPILDDALMARIWTDIMRHPRFHKGKTRPINPYRQKVIWAIATAAVLLLALIPLWNFEMGNQVKEDVPLTFSDIEPGERAILTLGDGSKIRLEEVVRGTLRKEDNLRIVKNAEGDISYVDGAVYSSEPPRMNMIQTPRGGQYRIRLPDGTIAWLNSASTLSFPEHFDPTVRRVTVSGEVYFEVAKTSATTGQAKHIPFIVETRRQQIEVLGTHFNINAYRENITDETTLLEGSVRVRDRKMGREALLVPGQQARSGDDFNVSNADLETVMAWKNGDFIFKRSRCRRSYKKLGVGITLR